MKEQLAVFKQMIAKAQTGLENTDKDQS
jgi:hypothetical protein